MSPGILVAFVPLIFWALGDFFIQKTVKKTSKEKLSVNQILGMLVTFVSVILLSLTVN